MSSRGKLLVQLALQSHGSQYNGKTGSDSKDNRQNSKSSSNPLKIKCTMQGSKILSGPTLSDDSDKQPDITCYESEISDTEITPRETVKHTRLENADFCSQSEGMDLSIQDGDNCPDLKDRESFDDNTDISTQSDGFDDSGEDPDYHPDQKDGETSDDPGDMEVDHEEEVETDPTRKRRKKNERTWERNRNKVLRMTGKKYKGLKKEDGKYSYCVERAERLLTPRECSKRCDKSKVVHCPKISEEERQNIFSKFWENLDWNQRKVYVSSLVLSKTTKRNTVINSKRKVSYRYSLWKNDEKVFVCKNMFLTTLGIGEKTVYAWLENSSSGIPEKSPESTKGEARRKRDQDIAQSAADFFDALPKMESHYCRSTSSKFYLEPVFTTFADVYKQYHVYCEENNVRGCRIDLLRKVFDEKNLSIYTPKKDQCDLCYGHETGNVTDEDYAEHIAQKEAARKEKQKDKERGQVDDACRVITVDLECVLLCPRLQASALYYKTKLACHNFTCFDLNTKDVTCYFWHEGEGDLTSNSFASCIAHYIESITDSNVKEVILWSDGCTYQNRNVVLSNTLVQMAKEKQVTITQKYLTRGHTQMEVDSVHSAIERKLKKKPIYIPHNYIDIIAKVRPTQPYKIHYLTHEFFKNYSKLTYYSSIRPGVRVGDPVMTDIRVINYSTDGEIKYKTAFDQQEFSELPRKARKSNVELDVIAVQSLHSRSLPIKGSKFVHLQQLKKVIPRDFHSFFDALPHE